MIKNVYVTQAALRKAEKEKANEQFQLTRCKELVASAVSFYYAAAEKWATCAVVPKENLKYVLNCFDEVAAAAESIQNWADVASVVEQFKGKFKQAREHGFSTEDNEQFFSHTEVVTMSYLIGLMEQCGVEAIRSADWR